MEVSDTAALARVLDAMNLEYKIISATTADVFAKINVTQLTVALAKENCEVLSMPEKAGRQEFTHDCHLPPGRYSSSPDFRPFPIWNQSVVPCPVLTVAS